jgi:integrase
MRTFKQKYKDRSGTERESRKWYVGFRWPDSQQRHVAAFSDKRATEELGRRIETLLELRAAGDTPGAELLKWLEQMPARIREYLVSVGLLDAQRLTASKSLASHLADWAESLRAKGGTERNVRQVTGRATRLLEAAGFKYWSEVTAAPISRILKARREDTLAADGSIIERGDSAQTSNFYAAAVKQFADWMVREGRATVSPVASLPMLNVRTDRRHDRQALSPDALRRLIVAAAEGPELLGMSGSERSMVYRLAAETGLRLSEIASLTRASFRLTASPPVVVVAAGYSKRRREDTAHLRPELAAALLEHFGAMMPTVRAFRLPTSTGRVVHAMRADLVTARAAWIDEAGADATERADREGSDFLRYTDHAGRKADFHSLRHSFVTNLASSGVHPKMAQTLARHSTITLTMDRYSHTMRGAETAALAMLPDLTSPASDQAQRATGTEGGGVAGAARGPLVIGSREEVETDTPVGYGLSGGTAGGSCAADSGFGETSVDSGGVPQNAETPLIGGESAFLAKRKGGDSNPRYASKHVKRFSKPSPSASRPPFRRGEV